MQKNYCPAPISWSTVPTISRRVWPSPTPARAYEFRWSRRPSASSRGRSAPSGDGSRTCPATAASSAMPSMPTIATAARSWACSVRWPASWEAGPRWKPSVRSSASAPIRPASSTSSMGSPQRCAPSASRRIPLARPAALVSLLTADADQLDREQQGRAAGYGSLALGAIGKVVGDGELVGVADRHQRHAFLPALDELRQREGRRLAARDGAVELGAVDERAGIVDGDGIRRARPRVAEPFLDAAVAKPARCCTPVIFAFQLKQVEGLLIVPFGILLQGCFGHLSDRADGDQPGRSHGRPHGFQTRHECRLPYSLIEAWRQAAMRASSSPIDQILYLPLFQPSSPSFGCAGESRSLLK